MIVTPKIDVREVLKLAIEEDLDGLIEDILFACCCESSRKDFKFEKKLTAKLIEFVNHNK